MPNATRASANANANVDDNSPGESRTDLRLAMKPVNRIKII